jgi:hypothetical protein
MDGEQNCLESCPKRSLVFVVNLQTLWPQYSLHTNRQHTMSDTYWPHQYEHLLQQLYAFLCVHCEYFYYIYFVDFPREGSSLPFFNQNVWISYGAKGMKLQNITVTHAKSIKFHPNDYPVEEAVTSQKLFQSCQTVQNNHMDLHYSTIHVIAVDIDSNT